MNKKRKTNKMKLPKGYTEQQFLQEVEGVVKLLAPHFQTYSDDIDDIKQEARLWAIEGVKRFDPTKAKLPAFLYAHIKNRLGNGRRNRYYCGECPCSLCKGGQPGGTRHPDRQFCALYLEWIKKNNEKQNVASPTSLSNTDDDTEEALWSETDFVGNLDIKQILEKIDLELPLALRPSYLRMREGVKGVNKDQREAVIAKIREIVNNDTV